MDVNGLYKLTSNWEAPSCMNRGELADGDEDIEDPELAPCDSARTRTIHVAHGGSFGNDVAECYTVHHLPQWTLHAGMDTVPWALLMGFPRNWSNFMVAVPYSPRFAWGGRPHRRFISVRERG